MLEDDPHFLFWNLTSPILTGGELLNFRSVFFSEKFEVGKLGEWHNCVRLISFGCFGGFSLFVVVEMTSKCGERAVNVITFCLP